MATIKALAVGLLVFHCAWGQVNYIVANGRPGETDGSLIRISPDTSQSTIADNLGCPVDLDTDQAGNFLVADPCSRPVRILKVAPSGEVTTVFAGPPLENPIALVVETSGSIIVADNANDSLFRISPDGSIQNFVQLPVLQECGFGELQDMHIVLAGPSGDLLVTSDECYSLRIFRVTAEGAITETITPTGVLSSSGLRLEPSGNLLIADFRQEAIFRVTPMGVVAATVARELCCNVVGLDVDPISGEVLTILNFEASVLRVDTAGVVSTVAKGGLLTFPNAVAVEAPKLVAPVALN